MIRLILSLSLLVVLIPAQAMASESEQDGQGEGHNLRHQVGFFLGNTHADGEDEFTIGADYEYRLNQILGVGALVDYAGGDLETTVVGAALFIHPHGEWRLLLAPGFQNEGSHNEFLFRAGISYEFPVSGWAIAPTFNVDFVDGEENKVLGVTLGRWF